MPKFQTTLLFDLDGTLIDSTPAILDGFHYVFAHLGAAEPSDEAIKKLIGHPLEVMFERLGVTRDVQNLVLAYKQRYAQTFLDQTVLLSGAFETVRAASEFANLGVVTTKTSKFSKILLRHLGIAEFFGTIVGREDVRDPKPSAEPILKALENLGICGATASKNSVATAGKISDASSGKARDASGDENTSIASMGAISSEILASDLLGSSVSDLDSSRICEQNLNRILSKNLGKISFGNLGEAEGENDEDAASDKSRKGDERRAGIGSNGCNKVESGSDERRAGIESVDNERRANDDEIYRACSVQTRAAPKASLFCNQNIFMIGDTSLDAIAAKSAAVRSVGVSCGYGSASELRAHFEFVCADAKEAVELIREISSKF